MESQVKSVVIQYALDYLNNENSQRPRRFEPRNNYKYNDNYQPRFGYNPGNYQQNGYRGRHQQDNRGGNQQRGMRNSNNRFGQRFPAPFIPRRNNTDGMSFANNQQTANGIYQKLSVF